MSLHKIYNAWVEHTVLLINLSSSNVFVATAFVVSLKSIIILNSTLDCNLKANSEVFG